MVGAFVSGFVAVVVALVALGWVQALIMLAGIIVVMQIEGHVLQPFLLGRAVKLHPLAVLLAIAVGILVGGIVGALMAVPLLAFTKSFIQYLAGGPNRSRSGRTGRRSDGPPDDGSGVLGTQRVRRRGRAAELDEAVAAVTGVPRRGHGGDLERRALLVLRVGHVPVGVAVALLQAPAAPVVITGSPIRVLAYSQAALAVLIPTQPWLALRRPK